MATISDTTPRPAQEFPAPTPRLAKMAAQPENKDRPLLDVAADLVRLEADEERAAIRAAIKLLHGYDDPILFAQHRMPMLIELLTALPPDNNEMGPAQLGELLYLAQDLAKQVETALDLYRPTPAAEGAA